MTMGDRLLNRRIKLGWAQKEAAHYIGVSAQFLGDLEKNKGKSPSLDTFTRICKMYGCSSDWLLGLPNSPEPPKSDYSPDQRSILDIMKKLPEHKREEVIQLAEVVLRMYRKEEEEEAKPSLMSVAEGKYVSGENAPRIIGQNEDDPQDDE